VSAPALSDSVQIATSPTTLDADPTQPAIEIEPTPIEPTPSPVAAEPPPEETTAPPDPTPAAEQLVAAPSGPLVGAPPCPGISCITIAITGDVLLHPQLIDQARRDGGGVLDFYPMLAGQQPYIQSADIGICHLETPLAPSSGPFSNYPSFSVPPQVLPALLQTGYDACSTASNHTFDQGTEGLDRTLDDLDAAGLLHDGSYRTEADSERPVIINTTSGRVGFISVAYDWNGQTLDEPWQANAIDTAAIMAKAKAAKGAGADLVVVAMHAGEEYQATPNAEQKNAAKTLLADPDIDLVYGHHAHVVQPMEKINGKWAIYGLGNNIAAQGTEITGTRDGLLVRVQFSKDESGAWTTSDVAWVPSYQDLNSPYRWCAIGGFSSCASPAEDAASLGRTTATVNEWGADGDGAHRL
jgi:poly-gamma-glutamate synthesis protein (capsule biosynthesis protein)